MNRISATTVAVSLLLVATCKGRTREAVDMIPDGATFVMGVDIGELVSSKLYKDAFDAVPQEEDTRRLVDAVRTCNPDGFKGSTLTVGASGTQFAAVTRSKGIGKKSTLECLAKTIQEHDKTGEFSFNEEDGTVTFRVNDNAGTGWPVDEDTFVFAHNDWVAPVKELATGKGTTAISGALKVPYTRADTKQTVWFAGVVPSDLTTGTPAEGAADVSGWVDLGTGVGVAADVTFGTAENAAAKAKELLDQFNQVKALAGAVGIPQGVVDSVKIEARKSIVHVELAATADDIDAATAIMKQRTAGADAAVAPGEPENAADPAPAAENE